MITSRESPKQISAGVVVAIVFHVVIIGFVLNMVRPDLIPPILAKHTLVVEMLKPPDPPKPKEPPKEPPKPQPKPQPTPRTPPPPQQLISNAPANVDTPTVSPPPPPTPPAPPAPEVPVPTKVITGGVPTEYYNTIFRVINGAVQYPPKSLRSGEEGTAKIRFHVTRDGTIKDVELVEKSGFVALDNEAKDAFRRLGKFPPVPANVAPDAAEFILEIPISFALSGDQ